MRNPCSIPWPFKKWFNKNFHEVCAWHDTVYEERKYRDSLVLDFLDKIGSDIKAAGMIIRKRPIAGFFAVLLAAAPNQTLGLIRWYRG